MFKKIYNILFSDAIHDNKIVNLDRTHLKKNLVQINLKLVITRRNLDIKYLPRYFLPNKMLSLHVGMKVTTLQEK